MAPDSRDLVIARQQAVQLASRLEAAQDRLACLLGERWEDEVRVVAALSGVSRARYVRAAERAVRAVASLRFVVNRLVQEVEAKERVSLESWSPAPVEPVRVVARDGGHFVVGSSGREFPAVIVSEVG